MNNILSVCREWILKYGKKGDGSLEYIGLVITNDLVLDCRIYRKPHLDAIVDMLAKPPYSYIVNKRLSSFCSINGVSICDVSCNATKGKPTYRIIFKLPSKCHPNDMKQYAQAFFKDLHDGDYYCFRLEDTLSRLDYSYDSLMQLGIEVDEKCDLICVKYYIRLENNDTGKLQLSEKQASEVDIVSEGYYKPIFIGINDIGKEMEHKLYFISRSIGMRNAEIPKRTNYLATKLGWEKALSDNEFSGLQNMGVFAEGIAMPMDGLNIWRLYFREYTERNPASKNQ